MTSSELISACESKIEKTEHQREVISQAIDDLLEIYKDETKRERVIDLIKRLVVHKFNCDSFIKEYETIMEEALNNKRCEDGNF
jgi:GTP cyclohydrolase I